MPLQNRVHPSGDIVATSERGTMLGNRGGRFHRDDQTLGNRRWATHHWICCELHYRNMHHEAMGQGYTSLFFLDEVTALAAGHRPCFFCRRKEAKEFVKMSGMTTDGLDRQLHRERLSSILSVTPANDDILDLPNGTMIESDGQTFALRNRRLLLWSFAGYTETRSPPLHAKLLTPPTILRILAIGYQPRWHPSALQWETP